MKILQCNIWGGRLGYNITQLLNKEDADVVVLQEAISAESSYYVKRIESIQSDTSYKHLYFAPQYSYLSMSHRAEFGLAILTKEPVIKHREFFISGSYQEDLNPMVHDYNIRNVQHVSINFNDQELNIINHHGYHVRDHKLGNEETLRQCNLIAEHIKTLPGETVMCGDFNLVPESDSISLFNGILVNHIGNTDEVTTRNFLTPKSEVCDYIFTTPGLKTKEFKVLPDIISDHQALTITL